MSSQVFPQLESIDQPNFFQLAGLTIDYTNDTITTTDPHLLQTGDPVWVLISPSRYVLQGAFIATRYGDMVSGGAFFAIAIDTNAIKLATTASNATVGTSINLDPPTADMGVTNLTIFKYYAATNGTPPGTLSTQPTAFPSHTTSGNIFSSDTPIEIDVHIPSYNSELPAGGVSVRQNDFIHSCVLKRVDVDNYWGIVLWEDSPGRIRFHAFTGSSISSGNFIISGVPWQREGYTLRYRITETRVLETYYKADASSSYTFVRSVQLPPNINLQLQFGSSFPAISLDECIIRSI